MVRVVEFMFVFGDAARLGWKARRTHKFLGHKFLRRYFGRRSETSHPAKPAGGGKTKRHRNASKDRSNKYRSILDSVFYFLTYRVPNFFRLGWAKLKTNFERKNILFFQKTSTHFFIIKVVNSVLVVGPVLRYSCRK